MTRAICAGSFDPVTNGHVDLITRAAAMFDEVVVAVLINQQKKPLFTIEERIDMLAQVLKSRPNVIVESFDGLLIDYARSKQATVIVRGLRSATDFDYEMSIAALNRHLAPEIDTVCLMTDPKTAFISSSIVKEAATYQSNISALVPAPVADALGKKFNV
ncbi:pantetheine-phosphate adenylyltransferase [Shouchella lonarensis]|uniref:Phosphopantetheine adenylyltransferase n=1 Tax=Shouchella lonarensis TaxID=1464122 RepID=A0A1G6KTW1_9BACI|nr:pantetheine-phosphate adenylyltransferase [Shouchella lonarensis]SDC34424.1 Phosphopantetheine adenylyltransferase [Shouchella lonarensis]